MQNKNMTENEFEIMYNALSVGWHLRKIAEAVDSRKMTAKQKERFIYWMARHNLWE